MQRRLGRTALGLAAIMFSVTALNAGAGPENASPSSWTLKDETDAITEDRLILIRRHSADAKAVLSYGCWSQEKQLRTFYTLATDFFLGSSNGYRERTRDLIARADDRPAVTMTWQYNDQSARIIYQQDLRTMDRAMIGSKTLLVRVITYRGATYDFSFDTVEFEEARQQIHVLCANIGKRR